MARVSGWPLVVINMVNVISVIIKAILMVVWSWLSFVMPSPSFMSKPGPIIIMNTTLNEIVYYTRGVNLCQCLKANFFKGSNLHIITLYSPLARNQGAIIMDTIMNYNTSSGSQIMPEAWLERTGAEVKITSLLWL